MKLSLSARRIWALALLSLVLPVEAAIRHTDVSLQTYVDFATNSGRYAVGTTNALLDHIRQRDGGVRIEYTESSGKSETPYTLPHEMISFDSVSDMGNMTLVGYNYAVTVAHNASQMSPTFSRNDYGVGAANIQHYRAVEEYGVTADGKNDHTFVHHIWNGTQDYKLSRLTKVVTDATPAQMAGGSGSDYKGQLVYRVGGGQQQLQNGSSTSDSTSKDVYTVAGVAEIVNWSETSENIRHASVSGTTSWSPGEGAGEKTPLPFGSTQGDSGSPYFIWEDGTYKFLATHHGSATNSEGKQTLSSEARGWTQEIMQADSFIVDMSAANGGTVVIAGADTPDDEDKAGMSGVVNGVEFTATPALGILRNEDGANIHDKNSNFVFRAVATGQHTWKSLAELRNNADWYTYSDDEYLNATESVVVEGKEKVVAEGITWAKLFQTQNLVFEAAADKAAYYVKVTRDTDLGAGCLHFAANGKKDVVFEVVSDGSNLLNSAGYIVDAGVQVNVSLRNADTDYMREWRKVGEGALNICGTGNNEIFLNVGGEGQTLLNQKGEKEGESAYAAYNVLVNTGSTVRIADTGQINRDLTFGNGGGTLDMNGQSMDWYLTGGEERDGFTINALTEEAVISNSAEHASLVFKEDGVQRFLGSFRDSKDSSLGITYAGGSTWELNGIRTSLANEKSGLTVQNGTVKLAGTLTVHGYGTQHTTYGDGDTADFTTRENDWHYADATMNVTVKDKAVFELESHARLIGTVTVESGGKYIMHEGVQYAQEYIEGGEKLEDTAAIKAYYGHKGDVKLAKDATLSWQRGSKEVAKLVGTADIGALIGVESTISAENHLQLAASDTEVQGRIAGASLSLQGGATLDLKGVYLETGSSIVSGGHTSVNMNAVTLQLAAGSSPVSTLAEELDLTSCKAGSSLTLRDGLKVLELQVDSLSVVTGGSMLVDGQALTLDMTTLELLGVHAIKVDFADGVSINKNLAVTALTADDTLGGYYATNDAGSVYFVLSVPEPATATLSLLALSGLMARRRRV